MGNSGVVIVLVVLVALTTVLADTAVGSPRIDQTTDREQSRQVVEGTRCELFDEIVVNWTNNF